MDSPILTLMAVAGASVLGAALVGFFLERGCGLVLGVLFTTVADVLCLAGAALAGWPGLIGGIVLVAILGWVLVRKFFGKPGARFVGSLWLCFSLSCLSGYLVGGAVGLAAITLPANLLFWALLFLFSGYLLPLRGNSQLIQAFRSLLTFSLGTNYPFHVLKDRKLEERVPGNPYRSFFAGPGIVLTGCDHVAVLTDGSTIKVPEEPGLTFTGRFEVVQQVLDLRPQLRSFFVEDVPTLDGIPIRVLVFIPFRINWGGEKPAEGQPFPFRRRAAFQAVTSETIEQQPFVRHKWDELIEIHASRIMRDIICRYKFDNLCLALGPAVEGKDDILQRYATDEAALPHDTKRDPRLRIRDELVNRLKRQMKPFGIEVIGGGISNLLPIDPSLIQQRITNWRTKWQTRIRGIEAEEEALKLDLVEQSQAGVEQTMFVIIARLLSEAIENGQDLSEEMLVATYITSLERMAENAKIKELLGQETHQKLRILHPFGRALILPGTTQKGVSG